MFHIKKPGLSQVDKFHNEQINTEFTYGPIGATRDAPPGPLAYVMDHNRIKLGSGEAVFKKARAALENWEHFDIGWVEIVNTPPVKVGNIAVILAKGLGFWFLNAARIVYMIEESVEEQGKKVERFGFAYGTLDRHMESGEERFLLEYWPESGEVYYDLLAFSRPWLWPAKLGYPWVRILQKRFGKNSLKRMKQAVQGA